jgi:predicted dehydrogenase
VVGAGFVGAQHVEALRRLPGIEPALVVGSSAERAAKAARSLGVDRSSGDWVAAVRDDAIDVVHVCVPNDLHVAVASAALEAGKHVVCEKPLATDYAAGRRLADAARRSDSVAVLCHNYRFYPMAAELRARVRSGELGTLHAVHGHYLQDWMLAPTSTNWRIDAARGGASRAVADIGTHWIDLAETVTGQRLEAVVAQIGIVHRQRPAYEGVETFASGDGHGAQRWTAVDTEDQATLLLRFDGGLHGSLVLSQVAAGHKNDLRLMVDGTDASASWQQERPDQLVVGRLSGPKETIERAPGSLGDGANEFARLPAGHGEGWADGLRNLLAAAYAAIGGERRASERMPLPTFDDGARHLAFVEAALRSAAQERWVRIEEIMGATEVAALQEARS